MLCRAALPRIPDVGWRLQQAFGDQLFIQLDGAGWTQQAQRCYAVAPAETLDISASDSPDVWQRWRKRWLAWQQELSNAQTTGPNSDTKGFLPGWYGYLGYEAGRKPRNSEHPQPINQKHALPIAALGFFPCVVIETANQIELCYLSSHAATADNITRALNGMPNIVNCTLQTSFKPDSDIAHYQAGFQRINDYIHAGDCYQVNFAQRFSATYEGKPYAAYSRVQQTMQSPFCGFVQHSAGCVLSFSPEQFIEVKGDYVATSPIKGTRPRFADSKQDTASADALRTSAKDQAENLMIVDLLRNDLSKVATLGSVNVPQLFAIESFTHVHHMVSTIEAKLRADCTPIDALEACFPGGSITGAPKRRACEIIDEVEQFPRSAYCGSLFYLNIAGHLQSNILIRTIVAENDRLYCWGGGGIVADSDCQAEFDETLHKVGQLMQLFENS